MGFFVTSNTLIPGQKSYCSVAETLVSTECCQFIVRSFIAPGLSHYSLKWTSKKFKAAIMLLYFIQRGDVVLQKLKYDVAFYLKKKRIQTVQDESTVEMPKI